jgi:hypothetical protein
MDCSVILLYFPIPLSFPGGTLLVAQLVKALRYKS